MRIESALALGRQAMATLHQHAVQGKEVPVEERVRLRAVVAYVTRLSADEANVSLFGALKLGNDPQTVFL
jgi:hypothetical protein